MRSLKFSTKSLHYRLALLWCDDNRHMISNNICGYFWQVLLGSIVAIVLVGVVIFISSLAVIFPLVYLVVALQTGIWFDTPTEVVAGLCIDAIVIFVVICAMIGSCIEACKERKRERDYQRMMAGEQIIKNDSFIVEIYNKFKNKTCAKIEFLEN